MAKMVLNKFDVACSQLDTAILLWFSEGDPVSIHTLACSAYQIIDDINHRNRGKELIYDSLVIKDEYRREYIAKIKADYNFFKHADKDANDNICFEPDNTPYFFLFSCLGLEMFGIKHKLPRMAFLAYFALLKPELLTEKGKNDYEIVEYDRSQILSNSKKEFYSNYCLAR